MKHLFKYLILFLMLVSLSCDKSEALTAVKVKTTEVVNITDYTALCIGKFIGERSGTITRYGIALDDGSGFQRFYRTMTSGDEFGVQFNNLVPATAYKYRAFVEEGTTIRYGVVKQFSTLSRMVPDVVIDPVTISENSVIVRFSRTAPYKEWGVHYSESSATSASPVKKETAKANIIIEGLKPDTKYEVRPYVVDENDKTIFLDEISFTTLDPLAVDVADVHNMHPIEQLRFVKYSIVKRMEPYYSAYRSLVREADRIIDQEMEHHAISDFHIPGYYKDPETHKANVAGMDSDSYAAYATALAYRLSGEEKYGKKAVYFLKAWSTINKSYSGYDGALAMARSGCGLAIAAELMTDTELWGIIERNQFNNWIKGVYRKSGNEIRNRKNNWADWGRYASILSASLTEDMAGANENVRLIKSDLFDKIAPDGHMPEEVKRGADGTWYTYFSLSPLTAAGWIGFNMTGENIFEMESGDGASIKKAVDYLLYYVQNRDKWPWHPDPTNGSPSKWPGNLVEALYGIYENPAYINYVQGSRPIIYSDHFTWSFPTLMPLSLTGYK